MNTVTTNYFDLFLLPLSFNIERKQLDKAYRQLQQVSHPDRFINQPLEFQRKAVQQSAHNTEAYQALKSPVLRACHLLNLLGDDFKLTSYTVSDIDLLMQQMQYREQLSEIKELADYEQLNVFSESLDKLTKEMINTISKLFEELINQLEEQGIEQNSIALKNHICELQFLDKLALDCDDVEEQLMTQ